MKKFIKAKEGKSLGFRTPAFFKAKKFSGYQNKNKGKFNSYQLRTQHKGGS